MPWPFRHLKGCVIYPRLFAEYVKTPKTKSYPLIQTSNINIE